MNPNWQKFRLGAALIFLIFLVACQSDILPVTFTPVPAATATAVPQATPSPSPSPTTTTTITPQTPAVETMSADVEGWYLYQNAAHTYRMSYPPVAFISLYGDDCLRTELYESGFLLITAESATNLPAACQPPQSTVAAQPEMIHLAGETIMAEKQDGPLYRVALPNGLQIDFGLLPGIGPDSVDSQAALAVIGDMLDSIRFAGEVALAQVTPTPIPITCLDDSPAAFTPPDGNLHIVYELDSQTWEWREETGTAVPLPPEPTTETETDGVLSPDGRFLVSLRQPDENTFEIWISIADGSNPRQLVAITPDEVYERYPQATGVGLNYGWVNDSLIIYRFEPTFDGLGGVPVQTLYVVDVENGRSWPILPPDVSWAIRFVNKGQQLIALTEDGVWMIDTADGTVRFDVPLDIVVPFAQGITFTPDDSRLFVYTAAGIALINPADGAVTEIPLDYAPVGVGEYSILPPQYWLETGRQFYTVATTDEIWGNSQATFTVWLVDITAPSAAPINTFTGFLLSAELSPDRRKIAFWTQMMNNTRQLYLADVNTGEQFLYDNQRLIEFIGWSPDSTQFLYKPAESTQPILGHICAGARPLTDIKVSINGNVKWIDNQRLLVLEGAPGGEQPLRLVTLDGQSSLIAMLQGEYPVFRFYFGDE